MEAFSKFGLFFKIPVEPWSQMLQGDDMMQGEKLVATLGFLWDVQEDIISLTMEPSLVSIKKRNE